MMALLIKLLFNTKNRIHFYTMLHRMLDSGVTLYDSLCEIKALELEINRHKTLYYHVLHGICNKITYGMEFSEAISQYIPLKESMMINASEQHDLSSGLKILLRNMADTAKMQYAFIASLAYPVMILSGILGLIAYMHAELIPILMQNVTPNTHLSTTSSIIIWLSYNFYYWFTSLGLIILLWSAFVIWALPNLTLDIRNYLDLIPPFNMYRVLLGCNFLDSIYSLTKAGFQQHEALIKMQLFVVPYLSKKISIILNHMINNGTNAAEALISTNLYFPDKEIIAQLRIVSKYSVYDDAITEMSSHLLRGGVDLIQKQAAILGVVAKLLMAAVILFIFVGIITLTEDIQLGLT